MALSKRLRYEVLRRDNFACRYCGAAAPDAKLTVDHVIPVVLGGTDDPTNLVAACTPCNSGKTSSTPDAPIIADVSAEALKWAAAISYAANALLTDHDRRVELHDQFLNAWNDWTFGSQHETLPLPASWMNSVDSILASGLPIEILRECVDIAAGATHVRADNTFRYMCGVAWRRVAEMREIATEIAAAAEETPQGKHHANGEPRLCRESAL